MIEHNVSIDDLIHRLILAYMRKDSSMANRTLNALNSVGISEVDAFEVAMNMLPDVVVEMERTKNFE